MKTTTIELSGQAYDELEEAVKRANPNATINGHVAVKNFEVHRKKFADISEMDIVDYVLFEFRRFNVTRADIFGNNRNSKIIICRQLAMTLVREIKQMSSNEVAAVFNRRDHGTVLHAETQVRNRRETDPKYAAVYNELLAKLGVK